MRFATLIAFALSPYCHTQRVGVDSQGKSQIKIITIRQHMDVYRAAPRGPSLATAGIAAVALGTTVYGAMLPCKCAGSDSVHVFPRGMEGENDYNLSCGESYAPTVYRRRENNVTKAGWQQNAYASCSCSRGHGVLEINRPCEPVRTCTLSTKEGYVQSALRMPLRTDEFLVQLACDFGYTPDVAASGEPAYPYAVPCAEDGGPIELVGCVLDPLPINP